MQLTTYYSILFSVFPQISGGLFFGSPSVKQEHERTRFGYIDKSSSLINSSEISLFFLGITRFNYENFSIQIKYLALHFSLVPFTGTFDLQL